MNNICIVGVLGRDPESRTTTAGKAMTTLNVGVKRRVKTNDGPDIDWFTVKCWGSTAEFAGRYLKKGSRVSVTGEMQQRSWEANGEKKYTWDLQASNVQGLDPNKGNSNPDAAVNPGVTSDDNFDPFA